MYQDSSTLFWIPDDLSVIITTTLNMVLVIDGNENDHKR